MSKINWPNKWHAADKKYHNIIVHSISMTSASQFPNISQVEEPANFWVMITEIFAHSFPQLDSHSIKLYNEKQFTFCNNHMARKHQHIVRDTISWQLPPLFFPQFSAKFSHLCCPFWLLFRLATLSVPPCSPRPPWAVFGRALLAQQPKIIFPAAPPTPTTAMMILFNYFFNSDRLHSWPVLQIVCTNAELLL